MPEMEAATLNCPMCGAAAAPNATQCDHCGAKLATVACPSCFGMIFLGSKFCQHCGAKVERAEESDAKPMQCPRCRIELTAIALGQTNLRECTKCEGLWVDVETLNEICADREKQAAVVEGAAPNPTAATLDFNIEDVRYIPCPVCSALMNRVNFSGHSGVIVDVCKGHGTWFDRDELRRLVEFIRAGGLEVARDRDRQQWEAEKRLHTNPPAGGSIEAPVTEDRFGGSDILNALVVAGEILAKLLLK